MRLRERFNRVLFDWSVRSIDATPPLGKGERDVIALSMVQKRDVRPYLLALKTFFHRVRPARVVVVADPTLDESCRRVMRAHVPGIEFREAAEFRREGMPKGGCWERLSAISEYVSQSYVIQLDADTVSVGPLQDVLRAVDDRVAFTLGTDDDQSIVSCDEISAWAKARLEPDSHIQLVAESLLSQVDGADKLRYVRGCAGFAGFPKGAFDSERLVQFSRGMSRLMPDRWSTWGTEQFTSNVFVASMPGARLLPHPRYCAPHRRRDDSVFFHFIGYVRYSTGLYAQLARQLSRELRVGA